MADPPADNQPMRPLQALYRWLKWPTPSSAVGDEPSSSTSSGNNAEAEELPARMGHYAIERKLGQGGMGVVYAARDDKLHRTVALKTMSSLRQDESARRRFWREARAAASVNHPNICQIYDIGEAGGDLFIAMELLEGVSLADRLKQGPVPVAEAVQIGLGILAALSALHARGVVHRDLKPSNVFLTPHGVKLLDFGLARLAPHEETLSGMDLTRPGAVMGTPRYMSPEQALGEDVDAATDIFAAGAILFEMLAGRPAFVGNTVVAVLHATIHEQPPALMGSPAVAAVDRIVRRALSKKRGERPASADAMVDQLRRVRTADGDTTPAMTHALVRLVVLPFRILRPDPETDFLAFSLADAITTSLSGSSALVVRSSATAARYGGEMPDLNVLATEADVDRVVMGTLLRSGDELRVVAQLVEIPDGTVITSHTVQSRMGDLFRLQDDIARRVVDALALPLGSGMPSPSPESPPDARAYEIYLRANEMARAYDRLPQALELYERCVALDPGFAPAWARLGRCYRVVAKYIEPLADHSGRAEEALRRALEINPRLTVAHKFYANLEADTGKAERGMLRLLAEARRHGNDPELFAGLVHACRYCGLFDESLAAHAEARRLDPGIATSFEQTILMMCDIDRLMAIESTPPAPGPDQGIRVVGLGLAGRRDEARQALEVMTRTMRGGALESWTARLEAWLDGRSADMIRSFEALGTLAVLDDPEALFQFGRLFCDVGEHASGLRYLERALARGYYASVTLAHASQFDAIRHTVEFQSLLADAEAGRQRAQRAFREAGGERLLGGELNAGSRQ